MYMSNKIISSFLSHPGWQGIGVIIAFIGLVATIFNGSPYDAFEKEKNMETETENPINSPKKPDASDSELKSSNVEPVRSTTRVISTFEDQSFNLCGYENFKAKLYNKREENIKIKLYSNDRKIPERTIQGFHRVVEKETWVNIFPKCSVMVKSEIVASTVRIIISYSEVR